MAGYVFDPGLVMAWVGLAMAFILTVSAMRFLRGDAAKLLAFLIGVSIAASLAGVLGLVYTFTVVWLAVAILIFAVIALLIYTLVKNIARWLGERRFG